MNNCFGLSKSVSANVTPSTVVFFDKATPTTGGVVFTPNTPATIDTLYISSTNASQWIYNGSAYVTYSAPATASTEWYLYGTTIDAGSNKTAQISRVGDIYVATDMLVGKGAGTNTDNIGVGTSALAVNTTGNGLACFGYLSMRLNTIGTDNSAFGAYSLYNNTTGIRNTSIGNASLLSNATGSSNTAVGYVAGAYISDGVTANTNPANSVFIGSQSSSNIAGQTNQIVIGYLTSGNGSNTATIGNSSITDTYLRGYVHVNNVFKLPIVDGTSGQVLQTNGSGVVTWATSGASGIWGIANSSGVYTYYATIYLALTAATSGQCIELFADVTVATETVIILKDGVNIDGHGHKLSLTGTTTEGIIDNGVTVNCSINNITITKAATGKVTIFLTGGSTLTGNARVSNTVNGGYGIYGYIGAKISGFFCSGSNPFLLYNNCYAQNITVFACSYGDGIAIENDSRILNCSVVSTSTTGYGLSVRFSKAQGCSVVSNGYKAVRLFDGATILNSSGISLTSHACSGEGGSSIYNCTFQSSGGYGLSSVQCYPFNSTFIGISSPALSSTGDRQMRNNTFIAYASECTDAGTQVQYFYDCYFMNYWNNAGGHAIKTPWSLTKVIGCTFELTNSSAFGIYSVGTPTIYYSENKLIGSANLVSATIVQGQTNTADLQGNIIIN